MQATLLAALPPSVRKGSAFPKQMLGRGYASDEELEAKPQEN